VKVQNEGLNPVNWQFRMETSVNREIMVVQTLPQPLAVLRVETNAAELMEEIEKAFTTVYAAVQSGKIQQPGQNVIVYRRLESGEVEVECGVQVPGPFADLDEVVSRETPAGRAATMTHHGPYDRLGETHAALIAWARSHGLRPTGMLWEVYGDWSENPDELRAQVFHQVAEEELA
jgi:effector-binding domain-containing protein